jgi:hypothetical protein
MLPRRLRRPRYRTGRPAAAGRRLPGPGERLVGNRWPSPSRRPGPGRRGKPTSTASTQWGPRRGARPATRSPSGPARSWSCAGREPALSDHEGWVRLRSGVTRERVGLDRCRHDHHYEGRPEHQQADRSSEPRRPRALPAYHGHSGYPVSPKTAAPAYLSR